MRGDEPELGEGGGEGFDGLFGFDEVVRDDVDRR